MALAVQGIGLGPKPEHSPHIMTIAKGLSSGYQPIGGSIVCDKVAKVIAGDEFNHGYTYSSHPVAAAVANENLRIMEEENIVGYVRDTAAPYLKQKWEAMTDHPMVGEAKIVGMMGSIALTPNKVLAPRSNRMQERLGIFVANAVLRIT